MEIILFIKKNYMLLFIYKEMKNENYTKTKNYIIAIRKNNNLYK